MHRSSGLRLNAERRSYQAPERDLDGDPSFGDEFSAGLPKSLNFARGINGDAGCTNYANRLPGAPDDGAFESRGERRRARFEPLTPIARAASQRFNDTGHPIRTSPDSRDQSTCGSPRRNQHGTCKSNRKPDRPAHHSAEGHCSEHDERGTVSMDAGRMRPGAPPTAIGGAWVHDHWPRRDDVQQSPLGRKRFERLPAVDVGDHRRTDDQGVGRSSDGYDRALGWKQIERVQGIEITRSICHSIEAVKIDRRGRAMIERSCGLKAHNLGQTLESNRSGAHCGPLRNVERPPTLHPFADVQRMNRLAHQCWTGVEATFRDLVQLGPARRELMQFCR